MNILITGASGLVGSSLVQHLFSQGHNLFSLQRSRDETSSFWQFDRIPAEAGQPSFDAVVHLAGENIANGRWNDAKKKRSSAAALKAPGSWPAIAQGWPANPGFSSVPRPSVFTGIGGMKRSMRPRLPVTIS